MFRNSRRFVGLRHQPLDAGRPFQVKATVRDQLDREKRRIDARLAPLMGGKEPRKPVTAPVA
jgi:hypothetical protein